MEPIEIRIRIIVSKDGDITLTQDKSITEKSLEGVPCKVSLGATVKAIFQCHRWGAVVGKKEAGTCHGCTVQCHMKGVYKGKPTDIRS